MATYKPIEIETIEIAGWKAFRRANGLPVNREPKSLDREIRTGKRNVLRGDDHAKSVRGIEVWFEIRMQVGFMLEWDTYRIGTDCLNTTSTMHGYLARLEGVELIEEKQAKLPEQYYTRVFKANYQALRRMYLQREGHKHLDWQVFREWVESLPEFDKLINPPTDKCKWRRTPLVTDNPKRKIFDTGCAVTIDGVYESKEHFKHCPYCGREIEVVR